MIHHVYNLDGNQENAQESVEDMSVFDLELLTCRKDRF